MPSLLRDGAVLQAGVPVCLRGSAAPGAPVDVGFDGEAVRTRADKDGHWQACLGPLPSGGPRTLTVRVEGRESCTVRELFVGEVWVCSGQSNMEFPLAGAEGGAEAAASAADPLLRLFMVPKRVSEAPQAGIGEAAWEPATAASASRFSAFGYWFGARLRRELGVPVGLVQAAVGNTPGEAWVPARLLEHDEDFTPILERWRRSLAAYPDAPGAYAKAFAEWDRQADRAEREGRPIPGAFPKLVGPGHPWTPGGLLNGMVAPLASYPVRGVIWSQGAAAPERAFQYRKLFRLLIREWRRQWAADDLWFLFAQEAAFGPRRDEPGEHSWAELREAQQMALAEPNTAMAVALDCGDEKDIHPKRKRPVADRLALAALARAYGRQIAWSGPVFRAMRLEGNRARLQFDHAADGLATRDGGPLKGFAVSPGATGFLSGNRGFVWADARIEGREVMVSSPRVPLPAAVRYAWAQNPDANLVNSAGLPAAPFRTDAYPGVTVGNR